MLREYPLHDSKEEDINLNHQSVILEEPNALHKHKIVSSHKEASKTPRQEPIPLKRNQCSIQQKKPRLAGLFNNSD